MAQSERNPHLKNRDRKTITIRKITCLFGESENVVDVHFKKVKGNGAISERNPHTKKRDRKKINYHSGTYTKRTYRKPSEQLFTNRRLLSHLNLIYEKAHKAQIAQQFNIKT